jgi:hypothetical protein
MTTLEVIDRLRTRGCQLRVLGAKLQYRPAGVLSSDELAWLDSHLAEVISTLSEAAELPGQTVSSATTCPDLARRPLCEAGPGVPAWHCLIDLGTGHVMGLRADGSTYCATCHPGTVVTLRPRST